MLRPNKINLIARLREHPVRDAESRRRMRYVLPPAAIAAVTLGFVLFHLLGIQWRLNREYDELSDYIASAQSLYADSLTAIGERDKLAEERIRLTAVLAAANSYGELKRPLLDGVYAEAEKYAVSVETLSFDRSSGRLELTGLASAISSAAEYALALGALEGVGSTDYGGYELISSEGRSAYRFHLACHLAAGGVDDD